MVKNLKISDHMKIYFSYSNLWLNLQKKAVLLLEFTVVNNFFVKLSISDTSLASEYAFDRKSWQQN